MITWVPRPPRDEFDGLIWLPRLIDKGRRSLLRRDGGETVMNGYLFGDNDFIDAQVLKFLRTEGDALADQLAMCADDDAVARDVIARSGRTFDERRAFSVALDRRLFGFNVIEADEGRMQPGPGRDALAFFYNRIMMPILYVVFRRAEIKRAREPKGVDDRARTSQVRSSFEVRDPKQP